MPLRTLPPAGTAIEPGEVLRWLGGSLRPAGAREELQERFRQRYGGDAVFLLSSGRALMTLVLEALAEMARGSRGAGRPPDEVLVPGYTCYSVAASAVRAGLRVRPVDVDPATLDFRREALERVDARRVVAVVSANLYGIPNDLAYLESFARERGIFLVDDAAQAMDARVGGQFAGTFGDAGLFSLDKGKNLTTIQGGVLLSRNEALSERIRRRMLEIGEPSAPRTAVRMAQLLAYGLLLRPSVYWIPDRLLSLGGTPWEVDYPVERYPARLAPMALILFDRIARISAQRKGKAEGLRDALSTLDVPGGLHLPGVRPSLADLEPVHLRVPLVFGDADLRSTALRRLTEARLGASSSYPRAIRHIPELRPFLAEDVEETPGATRVAEGILTLPTHDYVRKADVERMLEVLDGLG